MFLVTLQEPLQFPLSVHQGPLDLPAPTLRAFQPHLRQRVHVTRMSLDGLVRNRCAVRRAGECLSVLDGRRFMSRVAPTGVAWLPQAPHSRRAPACRDRRSPGRPTRFGRAPAVLFQAFVNRYPLAWP